MFLYNYGLFSLQESFSQSPNGVISTPPKSGCTADERAKRYNPPLDVAGRVGFVAFASVSVAADPAFFCNSLAALLAGSFYHTVCLDNLTDAFGGVACNMASSLAGCLRSVGYDMPHVCDVIPILDVDNIVGALTAQLQDMGNGALYCPRVAPTRGAVTCNYEQ